MRGSAENWHWGDAYSILYTIEKYSSVGRLRAVALPTLGRDYNVNVAIIVGLLKIRIRGGPLTDRGWRVF